MEKHAKPGNPYLCRSQAYRKDLGRTFREGVDHDRGQGAVFSHRTGPPQKRRNREKPRSFVRPDFTCRSNASNSTSELARERQQRDPLVTRPGANNLNSSPPVGALRRQAGECKALRACSRAGYPRDDRHAIGLRRQTSNRRHDRTRQSLTLCVRAETDDVQGYRPVERFRRSDGHTHERGRARNGPSLVMWAGAHQRVRPSERRQQSRQCAASLSA